MIVLTLAKRQQTKLNRLTLFPNKFIQPYPVSLSAGLDYLHPPAHAGTFTFDKEKFNNSCYIL